MQPLRLDHRLPFLQTYYVEALGPIRGMTTARNNTPDVSINLQGDWITGVFGRTSDSAVISLGFWTRSGAQHGPYGGTDGSPFSFLGTVNSFFGGVYNHDGRLAGIGFWTNAPSPPPAPPAVPVNFAPPPPSNFRLRSPFYGGGGWDGHKWADTSTAAGACIPVSYA